MKFGKVLKVSSENMPVEMHDLFLRYKELKKQIKLIPVGKDAATLNEKQASVSADGSATGSGSSGAVITATVLSPEEQAFIMTLNEDLSRFNRFFIEKEEEAVIRIQALCDELEAAAEAAGVHLPAALTNAATSITDPEDALAAGPPAPRQQSRREPTPLLREPPPAAESWPASAQEEPGEARSEPSAHHHHHHHHHGGAMPHVAALQAVKSRLVQFHGEMVLLLHWSLLNYAAVVKILKKHDKRTGVLLRAPYLANVLQQPFSSTTIMSRLAKRAEELVVATTQLAPLGRQAPAAAAAAPQLDAAAAAPPAPDAAAADAVAAEAEGASTGTAARGRPVAASAAAPGRAVASASEASTLTFAADREAVYADATGRQAEPLVGSTMHALETWANLRKNAITPSTVLVSEAEQQKKDKRKDKPSKRKADTATLEEDAAAVPPEAKLVKSGDEAAQ